MGATRDGCTNSRVVELLLVLDVGWLAATVARTSCTEPELDRTMTEIGRGRCGESEGTSIAVSSSTFVEL